MYCTRHTDPDSRVTYETWDTLAEAEDYAREATSEDGGQVDIYRMLHTVWPREEHIDMARYNGVQAGRDFPATL